MPGAPPMTGPTPPLGTPPPIGPAAAGVNPLAAATLLNRLRGLSRR
jgi:hypothetical protein